MTFQGEKSVAGRCRSIRLSTTACGESFEQKTQGATECPEERAQALTRLQAIRRIAEALRLELRLLEEVQCEQETAQRDRVETFAELQSFRAGCVLEAAARRGQPSAQ